MKIYVPIRYQNRFKQKDLFLFVPLLPGANINVPFCSNFILERRETFVFVPIFPGANINIPLCSDFCLERKDLFQFDIKTNIKKINTFCIRFDIVDITSINRGSMHVVQHHVIYSPKEITSLHTDLKYLYTFQLNTRVMYVYK